MTSRPFIINRDMITQGEVYMVQVEKWNSDRDNYLHQRVFITEDSAKEYMEILWDREKKNIDQFADWTSNALPSGYNIDEFTTRHDGYVGWNFDKLETSGVISSDDCSEMNWETDYGLTVGYSLQTLKWKPELGTYG